MALVLAWQGEPAAEGGSHPSSRQFLVVADPAASAMQLYRTAALRRTGELDRVAVDSHVGTLPPDDGRLLFVDDEAATDEIPVTWSGLLTLDLVTSWGRGRCASTPHPHTVPLTAENAWLVILGRAARGYRRPRPQAARPGAPGPPRCIGQLVIDSDIAFH